MVFEHIPLIDPGSPIEREPMYIGDAEAPLFAVLHSDRAAPARNCVAVVCQPLGYEYIHGHRSVRHLADALARAGVATLRFDYHGTGDSPGSDTDPARLQRWLQDVRVAISEARALANDAPVCLIGIRLGAALASTIAAEFDVDALVLWFPTVSGRRYVREQQATAIATPSAPQEAGAPMEAAGFLMTEQTQESLKAVNLLKIAAKARSGALVLLRDDLAEDNSLRDHLRAFGTPVESIVCPGYADMFSQPTDTKIPQSAIDTTVRWLNERSTLQSRKPSQASRPLEMQYGFTTDENKPAQLVDHICRFGADNHLVGIYTKPAADSSNLPTIVMPNSGSVHRVGSNLVYTTLARNLAALGFPVFRFDFEGLGDSVLRARGRENHPYPETATEDVEAALNHLSGRFGSRQFITLGLCSGAYYSFAAGLKKKGHDICEVILMNPPNLNWKEEGFAVTKQFGTAAYYKESVRSSDSWKKLLRGQVNVIHVASVAWSYFLRQAKSYMHSVAERISPAAGSTVANQLHGLLARNRHVTVVISSGDPGWDMLMISARLMVNKGLRTGRLTHLQIPDTDHTFSNLDGRLRLINELRSHLSHRYGGTQNS